MTVFLKGDATLIGSSHLGLVDDSGETMLDYVAIDAACPITKRFGKMKLKKQDDGHPEVLLLFKKKMKKGTKRPLLL